MTILRFLWQLPQNFLALLFLLFSRARYVYTVDSIRIRIYITGIAFPGAVSFGSFIFMGLPFFEPRVLDHEIGHSKQSILLGPLYLVIVGIPSLFLACLKALNLLSSETYHSLYPENWADKLGGIK